MNPNQVVNHMSTMLLDLFVAELVQESTVVAQKQRFCVFQILRFETGRNAIRSPSPCPFAVWVGTKCLEGCFQCYCTLGTSSGCMEVRRYAKNGPNAPRYTPKFHKFVPNAISCFSTPHSAMNTIQVHKHMSTMLYNLFDAELVQESTWVAQKQRFCVFQILRFETGTNAIRSPPPCPFAVWVGNKSLDGCFQCYCTLGTSSGCM